MKNHRAHPTHWLISTQVVGVGAHAGGADPSSDVGVLSDEEDVDDDERLHGTLTVAPLDGVHWIDAAGGRRLRLAVRAGAGAGYTVGSNAKVSSRARRLFGSASENDEPDALLAGTRDLRAAPGEPLAWSGPDNISASVEIDCAARDAVVDIALVASSSSYETTASHEVLAANRFPRASAPETFGAAHAIDATCHAGPGHASKQRVTTRASRSSALLP